MEDIFIELQIAIEEGSDLDLKNEDCHKLNDFLDTQNKVITEHKAVVDTKDKRIDDLLLIADHRWDEFKKAEKKVEELEKLKNCENCKKENDCYHWDPECKEILEGVFDLSAWIAKGIK